MKRDLKALQQRWLRTARLLEQGLPQLEVVRWAGISRESVSAWAKKLAAQGPEALIVSPLDRSGSLGPTQRRELTRLLKCEMLSAVIPTELWTLPRVGAYIKDRIGHQYSDVHVWRLLRELGFSSNVRAHASAGATRRPFGSGSNSSGQHEKCRKMRPNDSVCR